MSTSGLLLDLLALQDPFATERGIPRYVASHARGLLTRPGAVRRLLLNPAAPDPVRLDPALRTSPLLRWSSPAEIRAALAEGPSAFLLMSPFNWQDAACAFMLPARVPVVATMYDLIPLLQPELYLQAPRFRRHYWRCLEFVRRADLVLAISEHTRRDTIEHLDLAPERVVTIGTGVDPCFCPRAEGAARTHAVLSALALDGPYVVSVLGDYPRKNLECLLDAIQHLPDALRRELSLVIVGEYGKASRQRFREHPVARALGRRLVFAGVVPDDTLATLYQHAALHVFPSLYEGFGLPAAEAAACGCPSITSNTSSLPEVLEAPEATFDPRQPGALAVLMERVLTDTDFRDWLIAQGLAVARKHTWDAVTDRTLEALARAGDLLGRRTRLPPSPRRRIALVGPMPPTPCNIADYNARISGELQQRCRLDVFLSHADSRPPASLNQSRCYRMRSLTELVDPSYHDAVLYTLGNSETYVDTLDISRTRPGWVWLHDVQFHDLLFLYAHRNRSAAEADTFLREALRGEHGSEALALPPPGTPVELDFLRAHEAACLAAVVRGAHGILLHAAHAADLLRRELARDARVPPISILPPAIPETTARVAEDLLAALGFG